ncbi:MAG: SDR family NAD(P)-dependent oxidoreductase [Streptosporangiales bacterium]|nr:SDR family NAD(P)-dependent oxidoreductase [Streptosporangiales bacterium]
MNAPVALVTGASRGLGLALARELADAGHALIIDARTEPALRAAETALRDRSTADVTAVPGDVADPAHRAELLAAARTHGRLDVLVDNASALGVSPATARLADYPQAVAEQVFAANVHGPLALIQAALPLLRASRGRVLNISSDAAVEAYPGWGVYGASKAALDHLSAVLAEEEPDVRWWWVDPGEMRTAMLAEVAPDDDLSDRLDPADVARTLRHLIGGGLPSGRYTADALDREAV